MAAVLFTCAGQPADIVEAFGRAGAFTVAVDANPLAPALYHADRYALVPFKILARTPRALLGGAYKGETGGWKE